MDTHSRAKMAGAALWDNFRTHIMMEEYMRFGIENHPSISSEYVKFLITNSVTKDQEEGGLEEVKKVEERLDEVEKLSRGSKSDAGSASNAIDHLMKRVENIEKKGEKK